MSCATGIAIGLVLWLPSLTGIFASGNRDVPRGDVSLAPFSSASPSFSQHLSEAGGPTLAAARLLQEEEEKKKRVPKKVDQKTKRKGEVTARQKETEEEDDSCLSFLACLLDVGSDGDETEYEETESEEMEFTEAEFAEAEPEEPVIQALAWDTGTTRVIAPRDTGDDSLPLWSAPGGETHGAVTGHGGKPHSQSDSDGF